MSETQSDDPGYAELALDRAVDRLAGTAGPWKLPAQVAAETRETFKSDFQREIRNHNLYKRWEPNIDRLFGHVGTMAAFMAELKLDSIRNPVGDLTREDVLRGILIVMILCPQTPPPDPDPQARFRLCRNVLEGNRGVVETLRSAFGELAGLSFDPSGAARL